MNQESLFNESLPKQNEPELIQLSGGNLSVFSPFLDDHTAGQLFQILLDELNWQQPEIRVYGRYQRIPRLQVWMGDAENSYNYSGKLFQPTPWHDAVLTIKERVEILTSCAYNSVLINQYRDGQDSVSWHSDDESELDSDTPIASVSLGITRKFELKPNDGIETKQSIELKHNTLLVMSPDVQTHWKHQIPKQRHIKEPRINLTFRKIN